MSSNVDQNVRPDFDELIQKILTTHKAILSLMTLPWKQQDIA